MKKSGRKWWIILLILIVAGAGWFFWQQRNQTAVSYKEEVAAKGDVNVTFSFTGEIMAPNSQTIVSDSASTVRDLYVTQNQEVAKGERLIRLDDGTVYKSEIAGEVIALPIHKGDFVEEGQTLATVTDMSRKQVEISIDEYDVEAVSIGVLVEVGVTALGKTVSGVVTGLNKQADTSEQIAYYTATVEVETSPDILPGMQVEAVLVKDSVHDAVVVHAKALQFSESNEAYVLVSDGKDGQTMRAVDTGLTDGILVEIRSGLAAGETVYYIDRDTSLEDLMRAFGRNRRGMN